MGCLGSGENNSNNVSAITMKYIYIAGLEHSGTTLTDHLLSQHPNFIGLGEIASFFSTVHMNQYMKKWGNYPDVSLCSCGKTWKECNFWGHLVHLCGLNSDSPIIGKYKELIDYIRSNFGEETAIVDSSKSLPVLKTLINGHSELKISIRDILVIFSIKDVRSFTASISKKSGSEKSFLSVFHNFNLWHGANKQFLDYLKSNCINFSINLYEKLCADAENFINNQFEKCGFSSLEKIDVSHNSSHIAMGNKNFAMRNRAKIIYDSTWYNDDTINLMYLIHSKARAFNKRLYSFNQNTKS